MSGNRNAKRVDQVIGRVVGLWRYPVKSMAAEALHAVDVSWHGLAGDRRWAFVREGLERSGFPWLTLRQRADMRHYIPAFADPARPDASATIVRTPSGAQLDVVDPKLAVELASDGARVMRLDRGAFDAFPLSLITTATIAAIGDRAGLALDPQRFRPNLLVEADSAEPFVEDTWVGRLLRIGALRMRVDARDGRCVVITIDPATSEREPAVLRTVAHEREGKLGVYGSTVTPGRIALQDAVAIEEDG
jgi:uncharacterized protein YcbX